MCLLVAGLTLQFEPEENVNSHLDTRAQIADNILHLIFADSSQLMLCKGNDHGYNCWFTYIAAVLYKSQMSLLISDLCPTLVPSLDKLPQPTVHLIC